MTWYEWYIIVGLLYTLAWYGTYIIYRPLNKNIIEMFISVFVRTIFFPLYLVLIFAAFHKQLLVIESGINKILEEVCHEDKSNMS